MKITAVLLLGLTALGSAQLEWWQTSTFYQVYPRSFKDGGFDGIGDIPGIIEKLDHFVDIGIGGVWLSPVFKSPMKDFGYDVSNFREIDPIFGTMADFDALVVGCRNRGLKLILDFVPNHSSDEHDWFIRSKAREDPYTDYYTWVDPAGYNATGAPIAPNNWISVFGGPAWEWVEERQQFYLHQFHAGQPDLNYRNPLVLEEMNDVLRFWLDKGADGFRLDAVPHLMEEPGLPDEPPTNDPNYGPDQWGSLEHIYTKDQPELYDIIYGFRDIVDQKQGELGRPLVMLVEAYTNITNTMKYYGNGTHPGAHFPFNFQLIDNLKNETDAAGLQSIINTWFSNLPSGAWSNWVVGNHDQPRVAGRFGTQFGLTSIILGQLLPGTAVTYNGEELNMENTWISWADTVDPQGCQAGPDEYWRFSRDPERTPFQWSAEAMAGFTTGSTTWLPINENYVTLNLEAQKVAAKSPYKVYKRLTEARKNIIAVQTGELRTYVLDTHIFSFARAVPAGNPSVLVVVNLGFEDQVVNANPNNDLPVIANFYTGSLEAVYAENEEVSTVSLAIPARGALVLTYDALV
ncbi:maltase A3-like [Neocloeon triangulifer]|uniref:maltase A3-like n=1 Tax=Neocloeon triangulifer TaxID=2078957 RepID=UPI00286F0DF8|nr:maltase A3-like [Neocloeon triangulifer]